MSKISSAELTNYWRSEDRTISGDHLSQYLVSP
jgi:hypothetical protein